MVVKGNNATDAGAYTLKVEDTVSLTASSGSTSIACAADGSSIDGTYPAGTYYALVSSHAPWAPLPRMIGWAEDWKVGLVHIQPGRPMQNGHDPRPRPALRRHE